MEIEMKYALPDEDSFRAGRDEDIVNHSSEQRTRHMASYYYENDRGELHALRFALRFRMEGGIPVCCIKYGGGDDKNGLKAREELEFEAENIESGVARLLTMDNPQSFKDAISRPLHVAAEVSFTRRSAMLTFDDFTCELAMDEGFFGGKIPFREMEFELKSGSRDSMLVFCNKIAEKYGLKPQLESKLARALRV